MASDPSIDEAKAWIIVKAKDFTYPHGYWREPTPSDETANLIRGTKVEATALVNIEEVTSGGITLQLRISKPTESFGWDYGDLHFTAEHGDKSSTRDITASYQWMRPGEPQGTIILSLTLSTTGGKEVRVSVVDKAEDHLKGGLILHDLFIQ